MLCGAVPDNSRVVLATAARVEKGELEWRKAESRVRRWSSRRDQAGGGSSR